MEPASAHARTVELFDRAESGVLRASLRKLVTLNLQYRSIGGPADRPTDGRVVKRRSDIRKRNEILPYERFGSNGMRVCACVYDLGIPSDFDSTNLALSLFVRSATSRNRQDQYGKICPSTSASLPKLKTICRNFKNLPISKL